MTFLSLWYRIYAVSVSTRSARVLKTLKGETKMTIKPLFDKVVLKSVVA